MFSGMLMYTILNFGFSVIGSFFPCIISFVIAYLQRSSYYLCYFMLCYHADNNEVSIFARTNTAMRCLMISLCIFMNLDLHDTHLMHMPILANFHSKHGHVLYNATIIYILQILRVGRYGAPRSHWWRVYWYLPGKHYSVFSLWVWWAFFMFLSLVLYFICNILIIQDSYLYVFKT